MDIKPIDLLTGWDRARDALDRLQPGDELLVRFGRFGSQSAIVHDITRAGNVRVRKYRQRSRSYTKPVRIDALDIITIFDRKGA